jgi:hypothetical protein
MEAEFDESDKTLNALFFNHGRVLGWPYAGHK